MKRTFDAIRSGPSANPSKARHFVSAADRVTWNAKLDSADLTGITSTLDAVIAIDVSGNVTLKSDSADVTLNPHSSFHLVTGTTTVAESNGTNLDIKVPLVVDNAFSTATGSLVSSIPIIANNNVSTATGTVLSVSGITATPKYGGSLTVSSKVLTAAYNTSFVNVFPLLSSGVVTINAIDIGSLTDGALLRVGLLPASGSDLVGTDTLNVEMGFDNSGAPLSSTTTGTAAPISTVTGSTITLIGGGVLQFMYVSGFAGSAGAWVQI
jgi:hypothetical protein